MTAHHVSALAGLLALLLAGCGSVDPSVLGGDTILVYPDSVDRGSATPYRVTKLVCPNTRETQSVSRTFEPGEAADSLVLNGHRLVVPRGAVRERPVTFRLTHHQNGRHLQVEATSEPEIEGFETPLVLGLSYAACPSVPDPDALRVIREDDSTDKQGSAQGRWIFTPLENLSTYTLASPS